MCQLSLNFGIFQVTEGPHDAWPGLEVPLGHQPLPSRNEAHEGEKRKGEERKRTEERREDQGGKKQPPNGGDLRGGTRGSETSKGVRAWALVAAGSGDHPRPDGAGGRAPPDALERVGGAGARRSWGSRLRTPLPLAL